MKDLYYGTQQYLLTEDNFDIAFTLGYTGDISQIGNPYTYYSFQYMMYDSYLNTTRVAG